MLAPTIAPGALKKMRTNLPCRPWVSSRRLKSTAPQTYEARRVVVAHRLRIAERLEDGVGLNDLLLKLAKLSVKRRVGFGLSESVERGGGGEGGVRSDGSEVLDDLLGRLGLSGARLSAVRAKGLASAASRRKNAMPDLRDEDRLRLAMGRHLLPSVLGDGVDVRRVGFAASALVL